MDGFFVGGLHNFFPEEGHSDEGDDQEIIESNEGALFSDESSCGSINTRYEDTMWEDFIVWDGYNVYAYCARLKKNDPALKEVGIHETIYAKNDNSGFEEEYKSRNYDSRLSTDS